MSQFTDATIRDMSDASSQQDHWLANFILNTMLRVKLDEGVRQTFFNFLRQTESAFRQYANAREKTSAYLRNNESVRSYLAAIDYWDGFLSHSYQAYCLLTRGQRVLFQPNDGSTLQRLNLLYNRSKHTDKAITAGQLPLNGTIAVWLTNAGLRSVDGTLSFDEAAEILEDLAWWADAIQDPLTLQEKLTAKFPVENEGQVQT